MAARRFDGRSMHRFWEKPERISRRPILISSYSSASPLVSSDYPGEALVPSAGAEGGRPGAGVSGKAPSTGYVGIRVGPYKYIEIETGEGELYVLSQDQAELENRYSDPRYSRIVSFFGRELDRLRGCRAQESRKAKRKWPRPPQ